MPLGVDSSGVRAVYAGGEDYDPAPSAPVEETLGMFMLSNCLLIDMCMSGTVNQRTLQVEWNVERKFVLFHSL